MKLIQLLRLFFTVFGLWVLSLSAFADKDTSRNYLIDEPIFQGQAYIVEAGNPEKPLLIFVHGLGDRAADTWRRFIPEMSKDYYVVCFDLPGFGRSSKANRLYSPDNYVQFIRYVAKRYSHKTFKLVGHSMGGNIALRYAATYPEQVERLMLIDAAGVLHRHAYVQFLNHYGIKILPEFYAQQAQDLESVSDFLLGPLTENANLIEFGEQLILTQPALRENLLGGEPHAISAYAMIMTDYSRILETIKVPTLILWGGQDAVIPLRNGKVLARKLPDSGLIIFKLSGHSPMGEEPERFVEILKQFMGLDNTQYHALLAKYRYAKPGKSEVKNNRHVDCTIKSTGTIEGSYDEVTIKNCRDLLLSNISARKMILKNSKIRIENCYIENSSENALEIIDSDVLITACDIKGIPAIAIKSSNMDLAGVNLYSKGDVIINMDKKQNRAGNSINRGKLLFSVCKINSEFMQKPLHGPVLLRPGEGL